MEKEYGYAVIAVEEYRDLIETSIYYDEMIDENKMLKMQIRELELSLKDKIIKLKKMLLESNISNWDLEHGNKEDLIDINNPYFPFTKEFIEEIDLPMEDVVAFILDKKEKLLRKENEEQK